MTKQQDNILAVTLTAIAGIALLTFNILATERMLSMSEAELFEALIGTFGVLENFHPSVAAFLAVFSLTVVWILAAVYIIACLIIVVRWFKERRNDS